MLAGVATLPGSDQVHGPPNDSLSTSLVSTTTQSAIPPDTIRLSVSVRTPPERGERRGDSRARVAARRPVRSQEPPPEQNQHRRRTERRPLLRVALGRSTPQRSRHSSSVSDSVPMAEQDSEHSTYVDRVLAMSRIRSATTPNGPTTTALASNNPFNQFLDRPIASTSRQPSDDAPGSSDQTGRHHSDSVNSMTSQLPSIHFVPAQEPTRSRPSLDFSRITRILPSNKSIIRVGRYSERDTSSDSNTKTPSDAPIGFKSKVVSRRHCEFTYENNQWWIKDVKSSSGTFLNHIRLSQPGVESKPFPVNDGDIVQLGIDFKGGEEMIFRCVKIRVETNRGWQKAVNKFNKSTYRNLQRLAKHNSGKDNETASKHSTECTICLNSIAPCQALFVAPCSHTWHYRCIRKMLNDPRSSQFLCPNCRAHADLDADIEEPELEYLEDDDDDEFVDAAYAAVTNVTPPSEQASQGTHADEHLPSINRVMSNSTDPDTNDRAISDLTPNLGFISLSPTRQLEPFSTPNITTSTSNGRLEPQSPTTPTLARAHIPPSTHGLDPNASAFVPGSGSLVEHRQTLTAPVAIDDASGSWNVEAGARASPDPSALAREGPMTPRNTAGPFVFDGSASGDDLDNGEAMASLNGAAAA